MSKFIGDKQMRGLHKGVRYVYLSAVATVSLCSIALTQVTMVHADTTEQSSDTVVRAVVEEDKANQNVDSENIKKTATTKDSAGNASSTEANSTSQGTTTSVSSVSKMDSSATSASSSMTMESQSSSFTQTRNSSSIGSTDAATSKAEAADKESTNGNETETKVRVAKVAAVRSRAKVNDSTELIKKNGHVYRYNSQTNQYVKGFYTDNTQDVTYYYDPASAAMVIGQRKINNHWYSFAHNTGIMQTGFQILNDGANGSKTVYYNEIGQMLYGQRRLMAIGIYSIGQLVHVRQVFTLLKRG